MKGLIDTGEYIVLGVNSDQYDPSDPEKYIAGALLTVCDIIFA